MEKKGKISSLCLNMIVKNESKIILRFLESVYLLLDSYCICDTGSTDNTIDLITYFFNEKKIPGKIIQEPFRDFGYNRTFSLQSCQDPNSCIYADYILLLDADMIVIINPDNIYNLKKNLLNYDAHLVNQGTDKFHYKNVRFIKNHKDIIYWGVTHEYVQLPKNSTLHTIDKEDFFILDIGDGGCKEDKIERDIRLLKRGLQEVPNNDRYTFYLANSYRDKGDYEMAIEYYKKRIELKGWIEEIWYSNYMIGNCYKRLNQWEKAIYFWLEAYEIYPCRIENLYKIIKYYRIHGKHYLANIFYHLANKERIKTKTWEYLFTELDIYYYKLDYELSIFGYYSNIHKTDLSEISMKVLGHECNDIIARNVLSNYKFYTPSLITFALPMLENNICTLQSIGKKMMNKHSNKDSMVATTPSVCFGKDKKELLICVRYVNYRIDETGQYINQDHIITKNVMATIDISSSLWNKKTESLLSYNSSFDNYYVGQEDLRLHRMEIKQSKKKKQILHSYNANRCISNGTMNVEHGEIKITLNSSFPFYENVNSFILNKKKNRSIEKNWVLFDDDGIEKCIYEWYPLTFGIIDKEKKEFIETETKEVPFFFQYVRGSSNGIIIKDEIWFLCHVVSYEDRRYYYHLIVILDKNTLQLKSYTKLFTMEKKSVEYTLGMVLLKDELTFLLGYSLFDCESKYMMILKTTFDSMILERI